MSDGPNATAPDAATEQFLLESALAASRRISLLNAHFVEEYINAVAMHGYRSPVVSVESLSTPVASLGLDAFLGYSVVPITAAGALAEFGAAVEYVAMPHVYVRKQRGCGEAVTERADLAAKARTAGLTREGFAPKRGTPPSLWDAEIHRARLGAEEILARLLAVYGLPETPRSSVADRRPRSFEREPMNPRSAVEIDTDRPGPALDIEGDDDFFYYILGKVKAAFERTDIARYQRRIGAQWWYSVCALPLRREKDLLLGLKWGADPRGHRAQTHPPTSAEIRDVIAYRFIARTRPFLERHVAPLETFNYLNVCPFRAPKLELLTELDWKLAIDEFFIETLDYLSPPSTVIVGTSDVHTLLKHGLVECDRIEVTVDGKMVSGYRGVIVGKQRKHTFGAVPQPTFAMTNKARDILWDRVFG